MHKICKSRAHCHKVPPIIIQMVNNQSLCSKYDIRSVRSLFTGAAPLGTETAEDLQKIYPKWAIRQGYGTSFPRFKINQNDV